MLSAKAVLEVVCQNWRRIWFVGVGPWLLRHPPPPTPFPGSWCDCRVARWVRVVTDEMYKSQTSNLQVADRTVVPCEATTKETLQYTVRFSTARQRRAAKLRVMELDVAESLVCVCCVGKLFAPCWFAPVDMGGRVFVCSFYAVFPRAS